MEEQDDGRSIENIEVCNGPDCSVSGGRAALLEIEELAGESRGRFHVVAGGCRNFCTLGPNVHCGDVHFERIRGTDDCERIAKELGIIQDEGTNCQVVSRVGLMLTKKADRLRWQFLRNITSREKNLSKAKLSTLQENLKEIYNAEIRAAAVFENTDERRKRADRRYSRLQKILEEL